MKKIAPRRTRSSKQYELERSCFFRLERRADLLNILRLSQIELDDLLINKEEYYSVRDELVGTKVRNLQVPRKSLRRCHGRLLNLLRRIRLPQHIRSPRRRSTPWSNAAIHIDSEFITAFDIRNFYPSTTEEHIFRFFKYRLQMSDDCARVIAQLCTFRGYLPQGSPVSPHLACLTHLDLFKDAAETCALSGNSLSVWVDDVVVSGPSLRRDISNLIKKQARSKGLNTHKDRKGGGKRGIELTGAYIRNHQLSVANSSHIKIRDLTRELKSTTDPSTRYVLFNRLASMARYQRTVLKGSGRNIQRINARLQYYKREMEKINRSLTITEPTVIMDMDLPLDGEVF